MDNYKNENDSKNYVGSCPFRKDACSFDCSLAMTDRKDDGPICSITVIALALGEIQCKI